MWLLLLLLIPFTALAGFPPNNLDQEDGMFFTSMSEQKFNAIIDNAVNVYKPIFQNLGANLIVEKKWQDPTVNAYAMQSGSNWKIAFFGGLARRPEITEDGFALVICHEIGHHLGGHPFVSYWAADEGSSDYYSTLVCARKLMSKERALAGGQSLANLLARLQGSPFPSMSTPDNSQVERTDHSHPIAQCRLQIYHAGANCKSTWNDLVIPEAQHTCQASAPRCWYKPE